MKACIYLFVKGQMQNQIIYQTKLRELSNNYVEKSQRTNESRSKGCESFKINARSSLGICHET